MKTSNKSPLLFIIGLLIILVIVVLIFILFVPDNGGGNFETITVISGMFFKYYPLAIILSYGYCWGWVKRRWGIAIVILLLSFVPYLLLFKSTVFLN